MYRSSHLAFILVGSAQAQVDAGGEGLPSQLEHLEVAGAAGVRGVRLPDWQPVRKGAELQ